jgi:sugar phosphate isomerase/epimerase
MYRLRVGASIAYFNRSALTVRAAFEKDLDDLQRLGFDCLDLDLCTIYDRDMILQSHSLIPKAFETIQKRGIRLNGVHLPFGGHRDYSALDKEYQKNLMSDTVEMLQIINEFQPYCYIIHGSAEPIKKDTRTDKLRMLSETLAELSAYTDKYICVENLPRTCLLNTVQEHISVIDAANKPNIKACCDVNHFLHEKAEDALMQLGDRVKTLHISDHDYIDERHVLPKDGKIDWMKLIAALEKIGYQGAFNYEIAREISEYVFYTLADIKRNFDELFEEYNQKK